MGFILPFAHLSTPDNFSFPRLVILAQKLSNCALASFEGLDFPFVPTVYRGETDAKLPGQILLIQGQLFSNLFQQCCKILIVFHYSSPLPESRAYR